MRGHNILFGLFILVIGLNCHHLIPLEPKNSLLSIPENIFPANDTTDIQVHVTFTWSGCNTGNQDSLFYDFYLKAGQPGPELIAATITDTCYQYNSLKYNTLYFWQVVARNQKGDSSSSPVWSFSTRYEYNNPPDAPHSPHPENGLNTLAIQNSILSWSGGDIDSFSVVTYNIYFGKSVDSLILISTDRPDTFLVINELEFSTQYFWKVVAKDHYGLITAGPVWNFSTESANLIFEGNFDTYPTGGYPEPTIWTISNSGANLFVTDSIAWNFNGKSVCFVDSTEIGNCYLATRLPARSVGILEFCWRVSSNQDVFGMRLYSQQAQNERLGPQLSIRQGRLQYYDSNYNWHTVCDVDSNYWYQIKLYYNCHRNSYKIFVNDDLKVDKATWTGSMVPNLDMIYFITFDNRICQRAFLDEIKFYTGSSLE